jgi:hypothetical protein
MNEQTMQDALNALIAAVMLCINTGDEIEPPEELEGVDSIQTFEEAGVLTMNKGLVLRMKDHREFQVTIVQSR